MGKKLIIKGADFALNAIQDQPMPETINIGDYPKTSKIINSITRKWDTNGDDLYWGVLIPSSVLGGLFTIKTNGGKFQYAQLAEDERIDNTSPNYSVGDLTETSADATVVLNSNTRNLYLMLSNASDFREPTTIINNL